ncbi:DUF1622 domain-containing protein [Nocardioides seonyuensis]|uniref:DUF1622 domain-containing protein n=1 Tax=Nocardioides seonyuensis TaxID=2518371 RepID=A0A4P7IFC7_9ACTN|nr:DUF1622 domain-containing protein [Nocardioides seonyuensis]QBX55510.1 DUF1622 domain-containing protein [Nocardioides seonyuensis]
MTTTLGVTSWLLGVGAVVVVAVALAAIRELRPALALGLDFLLAAGLLRLASAETWTAIASAAGIVAVRKLVTWSLSATAGTLRNGSAAEP